MKFGLKGGTAFKKLLTTTVVGITFALSAMSAHAVPVTQLGFVIDESGSVGSSNYSLLKSGLSAAIATLPTDGTIEITVVTYSSAARTTVSPTILTVGTLASIQSSILNDFYNRGVTNTAAGLNLATTLLTNSVNFSDAGTTSALNLATDGPPNEPGSNATARAAAAAAAAAAATAGIDSLTIEAIGSGISSMSDLNYLASIAFPGPATILAQNSTTIPNPTGGAWVVPVSDFTIYADVVAAKVQAIVTPPPTGVPEPASLSLLLIGAAGMVFNRRRRNIV